MAPIDGKYQHVRSENFIELLVKEGVPEDEARKKEKYYVSGIHVEGKNITVTTSNNSTAVYQDGVEFSNGDIKRSLKIDGSTVTSTKVLLNGQVWYTDFVFDDEGYEELKKDSDGVVRARRYFKRI